jgi:protein phosphatase
VITRSVGTEPDVRVDEQDLGLLEGDRLLLCSDGLTNMVTEDQIQAILEAVPANPQEAADRLVRAANRAGGVDNITVLVLDLVGDDATGADVIGVPTATVPDGIPTRDLEDGGSTPDVARAPRTSARRARAVPRQTLVRWGIALVALLVVIGAGIAVFRAWVDDRWYVGIENGNVAIFRGIPAEVLGFDLSRVELETAIPAEDAMALPAYEGLADGINQNDQAEAEALVEQIRLDLRAEERQQGGGANGDGGGGGANGGGATGANGADDGGTTGGGGNA